jgi:abortive infection bacteriophage resistance protein
MQMPKKLYSKPSLSYSDQLQQLKNRGLEVDSDSKAIHLLEKISYFRLSTYWYPLLKDKQNKLFKKDAKFQTAFLLYCFDRQLRKLVFAELEKIEIAVRAKMIYVLSHKYSPTWYSDPKLFTDKKLFNDTLSQIRSEFSRADEQFVVNYRSQYHDNSIPSWIMLEVTSFGKLSILYSNLSTTKEKRDIAHSFGLDDSTFESWLHTIVYIRNICAHHSRLWNRVLRISPQMPLSPIKPWLRTTTRTNTLTGSIESINNRSYFVLSMILYLLKQVNPKNRFREALYRLFKRYPNVDPKALGFTDSWKTEPLWKDSIKWERLFIILKLSIKKLISR